MYARVNHGYTLRKTGRNNEDTSKDSETMQTGQNINLNGQQEEFIIRSETMNFHRIFRVDPCYVGHPDMKFACTQGQE